METLSTVHFRVELKLNYFDEFIFCGLPIPPYSKDSTFTLRFASVESYLNYRVVLKAILRDLQLADPKNCKYEIQRSKSFIKIILSIMRDQFSKKYN